MEMTSSLYCEHCLLRREYGISTLHSMMDCGCDTETQDNAPTAYFEYEEICFYREPSSLEDMYTFGSLEEHTLERDTVTESYGLGDILDETLDGYDRLFEEIEHNAINTTEERMLPLPFARLDLLLDTLSNFYEGEESEEENEPNHETTNALNPLLFELKKSIFSLNHPDVHEDCIICQDTFGTTKEIYHLHCQHKFHGECISHWLNINRSCPVCRQSVERTSSVESSPEIQYIRQRIPESTLALLRGEDPSLFY